MDAATQTAPVRSAVTQATADAECPAPDAGPADPAESAEMVQLDQAASEAAASRVEVLSEEAGITPHTPAAFVNREGVKAYAIDADGVQATSVTFPIEGDRFTQPSNLTFILDEAGNLTQYSESTVVEREDGILDVATYRDGCSSIPQSSTRRRPRRTLPLLRQTRQVASWSCSEFPPQRLA